MKTAFYSGLIILFISAVVGYEVAVWKECLNTNSWWYCLRILQK